MEKIARLLLLCCLFCIGNALGADAATSDERIRVIVTSDGEIDDECSMVRFLLYANEWDIEAIVTSSSQYHWHGHKWAGDDWLVPYLDAYERVYPNLLKHDKNYPAPDYLRSHFFLGNVETEGEMEKETEGSQQIVRILLDESDNRPVWIQAWGGTNTIARALKSIEEKYPEKMAYVAQKIRFFLIWEQDDTYQTYIRPHWGKYNILTINSDQFEAIAYRWRRSMPEEAHPCFCGDWMNDHILTGHGALCSLYKAHENGDFRSEGDSPAFIHTIVTGLRNLEHPDWGGWGGRYVKIRDNTWLDPVPDDNYVYPEGRWYASSGFSRKCHRSGDDEESIKRRMIYFKPVWRWAEAFQNDFAARADWCVNAYEDANHAPVVKVSGKEDRFVKPGSKVVMNASGTYDPDGDALTFRWWQYAEAGTYDGVVEIGGTGSGKAIVKIPENAKAGDTIHMICEVTDGGEPALTRYRRIVLTVK